MDFLSCNLVNTTCLCIFIAPGLASEGRYGEELWNTYAVQCGQLLGHALIELGDGGGRRGRRVTQGLLSRPKRAR